MRCCAPAVLLLLVLSACGSSAPAPPPPPGTAPAAGSSRAPSASLPSVAVSSLPAGPSVSVLFTVSPPVGWERDPVSTATRVQFDFPTPAVPTAQIVFGFVPGTVQVPPRPQAITIGGLPASLVSDGPVTDQGQVAGYGRVAVLVHGAQTYELQCTLYLPGPPGSLLTACDKVATSVRFMG